MMRIGLLMRALTTATNQTAKEVKMAQDDNEVVSPSCGDEEHSDTCNNDLQVDWESVDRNAPGDESHQD